MTTNKTDVQAKAPAKKEAIVLEQQYIELYEQHSETIRKHSATALNIGRDKAFEKFRKLGFPSSTVEN